MRSRVILDGKSPGACSGHDAAGSLAGSRRGGLDDLTNAPPQVNRTSIASPEPFWTANRSEYRTDAPVDRGWRNNVYPSAMRLGRMRVAGLEEEMNRRYHINLFWNDAQRAWIADIPDLENCFARGNSPAEALAEVERTASAWIKMAEKAGLDIPEPRYKPEIYKTRAVG